MDTGVGCRDLVRSLGEQIRATLDPLLEGESKFALVGFPNHSNVGDSAIWLGQLAYLRRRGGRVAYMCDEWSYDPGELARRLGDGTILIAGGGSLGDVWPDYERLREDVVERFHGNRIVQLPQTINFKEAANLERARGVLSAHPDFTLLARDRPSLEIATSQLGCTAQLCPDMAFALGPLDKERTPADGVLALVRSDEETSGARERLAGSELERDDWPTQPTALRGTSRKLGALVGRHPRPFRHLAPPLYRLYDRLADERLNAGREVLTRRRAVVTDRLHGHIMCVLLGVPHVCVDTGFGKIGGYAEAWTGGCELVHLAGSPEEAVTLAQPLGSAP
jgi:exopolysaccharide biosynthesis predicted pyruvyltransferase EpsI